MTDKKKVFVHVGPHKTGSTAIQEYFRTTDLSKNGLYFLHNQKTHAAAKALASKDFDAAKLILTECRHEIAALPAETVLLSQEDFAGNLIGRSNEGRVYPNFLKNLRIILRSLAPHDVSFIFVKRDREDWLRSCYAQNLRYRDKFHDYNQFVATVQPPLWDDMLAKPRDMLGKRFYIVEYEPRLDSGIRALLSILNVSVDRLDQPEVSVPHINKSIGGVELFTYERINQRALFKSLIPIYKSRASRYLKGDRPVIRVSCEEDKCAAWPPVLAERTRGFVGLESLTERVQRRVGAQENQPDLMPDLPLDISALARETMPSDVQLPSVPRYGMPDQARILCYHLRGGSRLAYTNALAISYLRRDTHHTKKAQAVFHEIWGNAGLYLAAELSTRWILSTLQTFMDHPRNTSQQLIGAAGYFYGNLLKIYEGERALEGRPVDAIYDAREPKTPGGFRGLDRYKVGNTDLLLNTNAMLLELAGRDIWAGLVLEEFLLRAKNSKTVFQRYDETRKAMKINDPPFTDAWSFFEEPKI